MKRGFRLAGIAALVLAPDLVLGACGSGSEPAPPPSSVERIALPPIKQLAKLCARLTGNEPRWSGGDDGRITGTTDVEAWIETDAIVQVTGTYVGDVLVEPAADGEAQTRASAR
jgi:hypothetical protein